MIKKIAYTLFFITIIGAILVLSIDLFVKDASRGKIYETINEVPNRNVALLLGTSKYVRRGKINYFYKYRIDSAVKLFKNGKVKAILVSGDNATKYYNEPARMRRDLIKQGIPKDKIYLDFAGFRTLDSMLRAKNIFGLNKFIVVSQKFHLERALFIAKAYNIDAIGFKAKSIENSKATLKMRLREYLARVKAFLDIYVLHTTPKFFGNYEKIEIRENSD